MATPTVQEILQQAIQANRNRTFYSQYPEFHKAYPEEWMPAGKKAFDAQCGTYFKALSFGKNVEWIGEEVSPFTGEPLGVKYPAHQPETLIKQAKEAKRGLKKCTVEQRAKALVAALEQVKTRFFEMAFATMHTTGQSFMMAFQASGPHASDRALEALAMAYEELTRFPQQVEWTKPMGKHSVTLQKTFVPVPKGIGLVIGCGTFPVWNSVPAIFANLMAGNPVIAKPHPKAVLPIALVLGELQKALVQEGAPAASVQLAVDTSENPLTKTLAESPEVSVIDFTGSSAFGNYIESLPNKTIFTEKSAINSVILDSTDDLEASLSNLAFSLCLYSGQMCTAPQNIFISEKGVELPDRTAAYPEVVKLLKEKVQALIEHPKMGPGTLAAIQNPNTLTRRKPLMKEPGSVLMAPKRIVSEGQEQARTSTPLLMEVSNKETDKFTTEYFGPVAMVVKTQGLDESIQLAKQNAISKGAITCLAFCREKNRKEKITHEMEEAYTPVTFNLTGNFWVNQHAAFSDFHVTGGNASGNASFADPNFVNRRFVWVGHREMVPNAED